MQTPEGSPLPSSSGDPHKKFLASMKKRRKEYNKAAASARRRFLSAGISVIAFSATVPVVAATSAPRWWMAALAAFAIVCQGYLALTRPQENAVLCQRAADELSVEIHRFELGLDPYSDR